VIISNIVHPDYSAMLDKWTKYRLTMIGGYDFIDQYLIKFSKRESDTDFLARKNITYCPAHAKAALIDVKNAIYQRLTDITREGGTVSYQDAVKGMYSGVDLNGNTMNGFIGRVILQELLALGKVGVYIDRSIIDINATLLDTKNNSPYIYSYTAEDIRSWSFDRNNDLLKILLRDHIYSLDEETGLINNQTDNYHKIYQSIYILKLSNNIK